MKEQKTETRKIEREKADHPRREDIDSSAGLSVLGGGKVVVENIEANVERQGQRKDANRYEQRIRNVVSGENLRDHHEVSGCHTCTDVLRRFGTHIKENVR